MGFFGRKKINLLKMRYNFFFFFFFPKSTRTRKFIQKGINCWQAQLNRILAKSFCQF